MSVRWGRRVNPITTCVRWTVGLEGYALFNHEVATGKMASDPAPADCGHTCQAVKSKDYIFHPYQKR